MRNLLVVLAVCGLGAYGSTITGVTTNFGTPYSVAYSTFTVTGSSMATGIGQMTITAVFGTGVGATSASCNWTASVGGGNAGCIAAGQFEITFPAGTNTDPDVSGAAGIWTITDLNTGTTPLTSLTIDGVDGGVGFDRCLTTGGFNDGDFGYTVCNGGTALEGTVGSAFGWSAGNATGGTAGINASALYFDALHLPATASVLDAWGDLTLTFGGTSFVGSNSNFTFRADTDLLTAEQVSTPEPGTLGVIGAGLLCLAAFRFRRDTKTSERS